MAAFTVLVPYTKNPASAWSLRLACGVTPENGGRIVVLALTEVHRALPLHGLPAYFDVPSWYALSDAETVADACGRYIEMRLRHTYHRGKSIIREALELDADAIFLPVPRPRYRWLPAWFDGTPRFVTKHAPCPVFTTTVPRGSAHPDWNVLTEVEQILQRGS